MRRGQQPQAGRWAVSGGFVRLDESLGAAAQRALTTKAGLEGVFIEQLYSLGALDRDPRTFEDVAAREADRILFCDTDALATALWHEHYLRRRSPEVEAIARSRMYDLTFLTAADFPWVQDGYRDSDTARQRMQRRFEAELALRHDHLGLRPPHTADVIEAARPAWTVTLVARSRAGTMRRCQDDDARTTSRPKAVPGPPSA